MRRSNHRRPSPALVISIVSLFVALTGVGVAATGDNFILGKSNSASATTSLTGDVSASLLRLTNTHWTSAAPALRLTNSAGPPLIVDSSVRVPNLNASFLDGKRPSDFLAIGSIKSYQAAGVHIPSGEGDLTHANCPNGGTALGGGYAIVHDTIGGSAVPDIITNGPRYPSSSGQRPEGWEVDVVNETGDGVTVYPQVVCTR